MKLLYDQNLSPVLVARLADVYPGSMHMRSVGLRESADSSIWNRARTDGYVICTKDNDFREMSRALGAPPKVVFLRLGNCATSYVESVLREHAIEVAEFVREPNASILIIE